MKHQFITRESILGKDPLTGRIHQRRDIGGGIMKTTLEVELLEIIETYRKSGYPDKYILGQFEKVLNGHKDDEIKGEWDT